MYWVWQGPGEVHDAAGPTCVRLRLEEDALEHSEDAGVDPARAGTVCGRVLDHVCVHRRQRPVGHTVRVALSTVTGGRYVTVCVSGMGEGVGSRVVHRVCLCCRVACHQGSVGWYGRRWHGSVHRAHLCHAVEGRLSAAVVGGRGHVPFWVSRGMLVTSFGAV